MKHHIAPLLLLLLLSVPPALARASVQDAIRSPAGGFLAPVSAGIATTDDEVSLGEAVSRVKRQYGGRILEAETREQNGRRVHVIKVLTDKGRVRTVRIPAGRNGGRER